MKWFFTSQINKTKTTVLLKKKRRLLLTIIDRKPFFRVKLFVQSKIYHEHFSFGKSHVWWPFSSAPIFCTHFERLLSTWNGSKILCVSWNSHQNVTLWNVNNSKIEMQTTKQKANPSIEQIQIKLQRKMAPRNSCSACAMLLLFREATSKNEPTFRESVLLIKALRSQIIFGGFFLYVHVNRKWCCYVCVFLTQEQRGKMHPQIEKDQRMWAIVRDKDREE